MAKAFSVVSWNVEHFGTRSVHSNTPVRPVEPIIDFLARQKADIVAVYEVRSPTVYAPLIKAMPGYHFYMTEGEQMQEILIGIKKRFTTFVTQKLEFKSGQSTLRPGVLVTVNVDRQAYPLLFLHLKSLPDPKGFGLRDDMIRRAFKFRNVLDKAAGDTGRANYIFLGDLNTMGFDYPYRAHDIPAADEIKELDRRARYRNMRRLTKSKDLTWWNGSKYYTPSNLDHVIAADHLTCKSRGGAEVSVRGWPDEPTDAKKQAWIKKYSDHALLYFEVQKAE
jgi:exonuclease III